MPPTETVITLPLWMAMFEDAPAEVPDDPMDDAFVFAPIGLYRATPDGRFLRANPALVHMLGYEDLTALQAATSSDFFADPRERRRWQDLMARDWVVSDFETQWRRADGVLIWVKDGARAVEGAAGVYYDGAVSDITDAKRLEQQLYEAQKMEAMGRLAAGISHDFSNLLTVILGSADLSLRLLPDDHPARDEIENICKAADSATALTRQLVAFSRRQVLQPKFLDLSAAVQDTQRLLRRVIGEDIELVLQLGQNLGCVKADPGQVEQVLVNLAVNARDAMPKGGTLTIETTAAELDDHRAEVAVVAGRYIMLAVSDTGTGMTAEVRARLFEPFFTTKELGKGTGLGLATVYGIVKQTAGYIWVDSEPDRGATFKVYLPDFGTDDRVADSSPASVYSAASETILLVEDDDGVRNAAYKALQRYGYTVLTAVGPQEAILACKRHPGAVHLLVTDVVMPGMHGHVLAERLTTERPTLRVLFTSGYLDGAIFTQQMLPPGSAFLQKPFTPDAFARRVRTVLDEPPAE